ncbi:MAG: hypothetical protein R2939_13100 [Kofleriaceae bacterium]
MTTQGPGPKTPSDATGSFTRGPAVTPADGLRGWLDAQAAEGRRTVRLPVVIQLYPEGPIKLAGARVGSASDALEIQLDDSRMGISLQDRLRGKYQVGDATCAAWLEGEWLPGEGTLAVTKVAGVIAPGDLAAASYAEAAS